MKIIIAVLFCLVAFSINAQVEQTLRFEVEFKPGDDDFHLIPADTLGLFIFQDLKKYEKRNKIWNLIYLDTSLQKVRENMLFINDKYEWIGYEVHNSYLYLLFRTGEYSRSDLHVVRVSAENGDLTTYDIKNELDFEISHFSVCDRSFLMGGYIHSRPSLILYDFIEGQIKVVPGFYVKDSRLLDVTVNVNNTFNVLILNQRNNADESFDLKVYDPSGGILAEDIFRIPEEKKIISGITSRLKNESLIITGVFGNSKSKLAEGVFWGKTDLSKKQSVKLIPFGDFSSIYDHLPAKRQEKMKEKAKRKRENNEFFEKEFMSIHRLIEDNGIFYLNMEMFDPYSVKSNQVGTPHYSNPQYNPYSFSRFNTPVTNNYNPDDFSRVKYLQAVIGAFDDKGTLLWDSAFVLNNVKSDELKQITDFAVGSEGIGIAYKEQDKLNWKYIDQKTMNARDSVTDIMLGKDADMLKREFEEEGGVQHWYNGTLFLWGYQRVKETEENGGKSKYYFYINKLELPEN